ncbi:MAG: LamG domain-containing protein [Roseivirga sp.]|nr:LamG domain-containing protein [Roseivirga sp.]
MRRILLAKLTLLIACSTVSAQNLSLTDSLILNLTFDNTLNPDESLGGQAVSFAGTPEAVQGRNGVGDIAYKIDAALEGINVQTNSLQHFGNSDFSYGLWVKNVDSFSENKAPLTVEKWHPSFWQYRAYRLTISERPKFEFNESNGSNNPVTSGLSELVDQQWNHIFVVRNADYIQIYINGQQKGFFYVSDASVNTTSSALRLLGVSNQQSVLVDDVVMYNRALSSGEVNYLYQNGITEDLLNFPEPIEQTPNGGSLDYLRIGVSARPDDYLLSVDGDAVMAGVTVHFSENWPDYVFNEDYQLRNLNSLRQFLQIHSHLPDVPSAAEVKTNGINLGRMDATLLKKIEELTLYTIDQEKKIENQDALIKELIRRIEKLEKK